MAAPSYVAVPTKVGDRDDAPLKDVPLKDMAAESTGTSSMNVDALGLHLDWVDEDGNHNRAFDCSSCQPCCGTPWNFKDCLYCVACFTFCNPCVMGKLWATSAGHDQCSVLQHCAPWPILGVAGVTFSARSLHAIPA